MSAATREEGEWKAGVFLASVPIAANASPSTAPTAEPLLLPSASVPGKNAPYVCPPRALHPFVPLDGPERKFAHSERLTFPSKTAPEDRNFWATVASRGALEPSKANEPAEVVVWSSV